LWGMMGSGKTYIGELLAQSLNYQFLDIDQLIEKVNNQTITQIVEQQGWIKFREIEHQTLKECSKSNTPHVLGCGGATPCFPSNAELLQRHYFNIYLECPSSVLAKRLFPEKATRPLVAHCTSIQEMQNLLENLFKERRPFYQQANFIISSI
jgi:shikimate kinase